jgi:hypothetical protein
MGTSFKFSAPEGLPRMIKRGDDQTLDVTWFENNAAIVGTVTAATLTLKQGTTVLLDNVAATTFGGPTHSATFDLLAATTSALSFSDTMMEIWTLTAGTTTVTARRSGHLVRSILYPMVTDSDLIARHARLADIRPPTLPDFSSYINLAWEILNRDLLKKGRRPELILDSYALFDMHVFKSLEMVFRDAITFVGDGRYHDLADMYADKYIQEWDNVQFRYDRNQDDALEDNEREAASPSIWLGEPPPAWGRVRGEPWE